MPNNSSVDDQDEDSRSNVDESQNLSNLLKNIEAEDTTRKKDIGKGSDEDEEEEEKEKRRKNENATPTEVFNVAASCLT